MGIFGLRAEEVSSSRYGTDVILLFDSGLEKQSTFERRGMEIEGGTDGAKGDVNGRAVVEFRGQRVMLLYR